MSSEPIEFVNYRPGALADAVKLHMEYYAAQWNFGLVFEVKVASEMAEFLERADPERDLFLAAYSNKTEMLGTISIDAKHVGTDGAHVRWFVTGETARGTGVGRKLLECAVRFCDERGYHRIYLTTFAGLDAARHLYESVGFELVHESDDDQWQGGVREQRFERYSSK